MCGIAGLMLTGNYSIDLNAVGARMIESLFHRGPDSSGSIVNSQDQLLLVHRRLSIQDLSESGKQPMTSRLGRYTVVFNGEIYNFKELATELSKHGHEFFGHSDTEVLLVAICEWGVKGALAKLNGMFAFALWDEEEKKLFLCRDRMGEKPLYYGWIDNHFVFSSELKAIEAAFPNRSIEINAEALSSYFKYGYINAPYSIYKNLYKLVPASMLVIDKNRISNLYSFSPFPDQGYFSPEPYWSLIDQVNKAEKNPITTEDEAIYEVDQLLKKTVSMQTIADVDVGAFLSGGIDSTLVSAVTQAVSSSSIRTFTIGFNESEYDESPFAEQIADYLSTSHTTEFVSAKDALNIVPKISSIYDEPFADSSQIPTFLVSGIARKDVTVCLSGDGGDELFAGYNRYNWSSTIWDKVGSLPISLRKLLARGLSAPSPSFWDNLYKLVKFGSSEQRMVGLKLQKLADFIQSESLSDGYQFLLSYWNDPASLMTKRGLDPQCVYHDSLPDNEEFLSCVLYWDQMNYLPGDNLAKVDRASMAVSLETRLPLLNHEMVELSWRVPNHMKIKNGDAKWLLKQVLYKYVPRDMVDRPKMGFSVPIASWLRHDLRDWAGDLLSGNSVAHSMLNQDVINTTWHEHINGEKDNSSKLWAVLMYLAWAER